MRECFPPRAAREALPKGGPPEDPPDGYPENRLSGAAALGGFLRAACASLPEGAVPLFAFDFDRTLTNGFAAPGATLDARIRGGRHTLEGLAATAALPRGRRCIVTARADAGAPGTAPAAVTFVPATRAHQAGGYTPRARPRSGPAVTFHRATPRRRTPRPPLHL